MIFSSKMEEKLIPEFSVKEFCNFLAKKFDKEIADTFEKNKISGSIFLKLSENQLERMVEAMGDVVSLQSLQSRVKDSETPGAEVTNDNMYNCCVTIYVPFAS